MQNTKTECADISAESLSDEQSPAAAIIVICLTIMHAVRSSPTRNEDSLTGLLHRRESTMVLLISQYSDQYTRANHHGITGIATRSDAAHIDFSGPFAIPFRYCSVFYAQNALATCRHKSLPFRYSASPRILRRDMECEASMSHVLRRMQGHQRQFLFLSPTSTVY